MPPCRTKHMVMIEEPNCAIFLDYTQRQSSHSFQWEFCPIQGAELELGGPQNNSGIISKVQRVISFFICAKIRSYMFLCNISVLMEGLEKGTDFRGQE